MSQYLKDKSSEIISITNNFYNKYKNLDEKITSGRLGAATWTLKEIIGHLIDSATNNHQRFVRLQIADNLEFPGYGSDNLKWVAIQKCNEMNFSDLFLLWRQYNILLSHIVKNIDPGKLENCWIRRGEQVAPIDPERDGEKVPLEDLITGYIKHIQNHLNQFEETLARIK
ncbi:MAG: hypothetical protein PHO26_03715 [Dehalococcoidia bacterium]|nr:hypothetical protein [Dehalococcoidia bacterium]MDD5494435.1 hypothetical protein [Dehalococcoidia bacterium]